LITQFERIASTVGGPHAAGVVPSLGHHLRGHVDADHATRAADALGGEEAVEAGAAPEVEHRLAGLQGGDGLRIATAEPEVGAVRDARQIVRRVAEAETAGALRAAAADRTAVLPLRHLRVGGPYLSSHFIVVLDLHSMPPTQKTETRVERTQPPGLISALRSLFRE
jgi:hypothetical protein